MVSFPSFAYYQFWLYKNKFPEKSSKIGVILVVGCPETQI